MSRYWKRQCPSQHNLRMGVKDSHNMDTVLVGIHPKAPQHNNPPADITRQVHQVGLLARLAPSDLSLMIADSRTPQSVNPPQNGPLPFFVAGQSNQPPSQQQSHYPPNDPRSRNASGNQAPPSSDPYHHRPQSTYENPQELGTSQYASPTEARPQSYPPPHQSRPQNDDYSPSVYSPGDGDVGQQPPQQQYQPYTQGPPQSQQQQHPPHQSTPQAPSPNLGPTPYPVLNTGPPAGVGYQAYHAPPSQQPQQQPGYVANAGGDPNDFYR